MTMTRTAMATRGARRALGLAAVAIATTVAACGGRGAETSGGSESPAIEVRVARAARADAGGQVEVGGTVRARTTATVASRLLAPVRDVLVAPGDRVRAGQVLVRLDDRDLAAQARQAQSGVAAAEEGAAASRSDIAAARATLTLARATHTRMAALNARKSATAHELDEATAALAAAESRLASAESRVREAEASTNRARAGRDAAGTIAGFATVTAPFAGLVTEKLVEPGNLATPGLPLIRIEDTSAFRLDVLVDESRLPALANGATIPVRFDRLGSDPAPVTVEGTVVELARAVDAGARSVLVKIALPADARMQSGTFARARFPAPSRPAITVPATAVVRQGQVASVFVVDRDVARLRLVRLGTLPDTPDGVVEVLAGVAEGELIVAAPPATLADGRRVRSGGRP